MKKNVLPLLAATVLGAVHSYAQIEYTDVKPDITISATTTEVSKSYYVDFDKDAIYEKEIRHFNPGGMPPMVELSNYPSPNFVTEEIISSTGDAKIMQVGDPIDPSQSWGHDQTGTLGSGWYGGERYLSCRFKKGSNWYYGWIHFSVAVDGSSFTMMDYAYNKTANTGLMAGQPVATGIVCIDKSAFRIEMDHKLIKITPPQPGAFVVRLSDMNGRIVKVTTIKDSGNMETGGLLPAVYVLTVSGTESTYSCKIQVL